MNYENLLVYNQCNNKLKINTTVGYFGVRVTNLTGLSRLKFFEVEIALHKVLISNPIFCSFEINDANGVLQGLK